MKYLRKVKSISVMIVLIMVLQLVLPISFIGADLINGIETDVDRNVVTKITATKNGKLSSINGR